MRHHRSITALVTGLFLIGLWGCVAEAPKSSPESKPASPSAEVETGKDQPPSGDVQERGFKDALKTQRPLTPLLGALPGEFSIHTSRGYVTAIGGGGRTTDVFRTDVTQVGESEKFRLWVLPNTPHEFALQTHSGNYVTAVSGGGRIAEPVLQTDRTQIQAWETFHLWQNEYYVRIQTVSTNYVTAVGGGGKTTSAFHTDATNPSQWETFTLYKCGDTGPSSDYYIWWAPPSIEASNGTYGILHAHGGGGRTTDAISLSSSGPGDGRRWKLIRQSDGYFALQTQNGQYYVTAVGGGGQTKDALHTDATQIQAWEKFWLLPQSDCSYAFRTSDGKHFLSLNNGHPITTATSIGPNTRFKLTPSGY